MRGTPKTDPPCISTKGWVERGYYATQKTAASIISGGLVAPIPAYTILTGEALSLPVLMVWVFCVSFLGVLVALSLRQQMLIKDKLPFPAGVATAETIKDLHSTGSLALKKISTLLGVLSFSLILKVINDMVMALPKLPVLAFLPSSLMKSWGLSFKKLGFLLDPSLLMLGFGMIMGTRAGISLLLGALVSWLVLPPFLIEQNWVQLKSESAFVYSELVTWTLWPGVGLMVASSLTSFGLGLLQMLMKRSRTRQKAILTQIKTAILKHKFIVSVALIMTAVLSWLQLAIFDIPILMGALAVAASLLLGIVSSRVSGETGIPPIGALGKVTQLGFGLMNPGHLAANLMTANVTGGAAGQSSDLLHDLKAGYLLKISHYHQILAQSFGIFTGAIIGSLVYVILIPDPASQLLTAEWPAPAVATWKSVAEIMAAGSAAFPKGAITAMVIAGIIGFSAALLEKLLPASKARFIPSASAMGLAFIIPAWTSITMFLGAMLAWIIHKYSPGFAKLYTLVIAAGFVAGESMGGVLSTILRMM